MSVRDEQGAAPAIWTRRRAVQALAAVPALSRAAPVCAQPAALPPELAEICLRAVKAPPQERLGMAAAAGRGLPEIAAALLERLGPDAAGNWHAALVARGRRDIAKGDMVEILGQPLMRTEVEVLALGVRLRAAA